MACWVYESLLVFGVAFAASAVFSSVTSTHGSISSGQSFLLQALIALFIGLYFVWFWIKGQTLAMKTWRIRVVDESGQPLKPSRAFLRFVLSWMWFLPALLCAYVLSLGLSASAWLTVIWITVWACASRIRADRQFWHDIWSGTRLTHTATAP